MLTQTSANAQTSTKLKIPRMVSVKAEGVNVRAGPGISYAIKWVLMRRHYPVEIIAEYQSWRKVRDWEGAEGWIFHSALASTRSVIIDDNNVVLRRLSSSSSPAVARPAAGVVGLVETCESLWCFVKIRSYQGWIERDNLWGLYPDEQLD